MEITKTFLDIHPSDFKFADDIDIIQFRNALHYRNTVLKLESTSHATSKENGLDEAKLLMKNLGRKVDIKKFESIKNNILNRLHKRGLISENVYESYKYDIEGDIVDVSKVIEGNPECMLRPAKVYTNYFYELYISLSIPWTVDDSDIEETIYKVLATVQILEREHIFTKINLVIPVRYVSEDGNNLFVIVPLFSHRDNKDVETMFQYINRDALRCFYFAIAENTYKSGLYETYGSIVKLGSCISCFDVNPEELASDIINKVIVGGEL